MPIGELLREDQGLNVKDFVEPVRNPMVNFDVNRDLPKKDLEDIFSFAKNGLAALRLKESFENSSLSLEHIAALRLSLPNRVFISWSDQERIARTVRKESEMLSRFSKIGFRNPDLYLQSLLALKTAWSGVFKDFIFLEETPKLSRIRNYVNVEKRFDDDLLEKLSLLKLLNVSNTGGMLYFPPMGWEVTYGLGLRSRMDTQGKNEYTELTHGLKTLFQFKIISDRWYRNVIEVGPDWRQYISKVFNSPYKNTADEIRNIMYLSFLSADEIKITDDEINLVRHDVEVRSSDSRSLMPVERNF